MRFLALACSSNASCTTGLIGVRDSLEWGVVVDTRFDRLVRVEGEGVAAIIGTEDGAIHSALATGGVVIALLSFNWGNGAFEWSPVFLRRAVIAYWLLGVLGATSDARRGDDDDGSGKLFSLSNTLKECRRDMARPLSSAFSYRQKSIHSLIYSHSHHILIWDTYSNGFQFTNTKNRFHRWTGNDRITVPLPKQICT